MTKGKRWTVQEEAELKTLVEASTRVEDIAARFGKKPGAIFIKCQRLGLKLQSKGYVNTSVSIPRELPSVEEALRMLAGALKAAVKPGLDKVEVQRLQAVATIAKTYKEILADYIQMFQENQFTAARWCRQSGKTFIIAALLLWYAATHPDSAIGIVGPSWRQTKRILSRIALFAHRLPQGIAFKPQRTQIHFTNGSTIEAFPNNPETVRGPSLQVVYCDEMNFVPNDQELYDAILYTLGATDGKFVCSSTPWHSDSVFFKIFTHKDFQDFKTLHVPVEKATEPNGPLKPSIIQKIKTQMGDDPARWRREMEAEWAEDEDVWLTQSLIASCIGTSKNCGEGLQEYSPETQHGGE